MHLKPLSKSWKNFVMKKNSDYLEVLRDGKKYRGKYISLYILPNKPSLRVGFVVSKSYKNNVEKNRVRRRLKELFRLNLEKFPPNTYIVMSTSATSKEIPWKDLEEDLLYLLQKI